MARSVALTLSGSNCPHLFVLTRLHQASGCIVVGLNMNFDQIEPTLVLGLASSGSSICSSDGALRPQSTSSIRLAVGSALLPVAEAAQLHGFIMLISNFVGYYCYPEEDSLEHSFWGLKARS